MNVFLLLLSLASFYQPYEEVLQTYVTPEGWVNYEGLKSHPQALFSFCGQIASFSPTRFQHLSREEKMAFWINAYNAYTLKAIVESLRSAHPVSSIRNIPKVWKIPRRILQKEMSLQEIEDHLRETFHESLIHMALNCASRGCPPLRKEPYRGEVLIKQLQDQARKVLALPKNAKVQGKVLYLSSLFRWYAKDFIPEYGKNKKEALKNFVRAYGPAEVVRHLPSKVTIKYLPYDWSLNEIP